MFPSDLRAGNWGPDGDRLINVVIDDKFIVGGEVLWDGVFGDLGKEVGGLVRHGFSICRVEVLKVNCLVVGVRRGNEDGIRLEFSFLWLRREEILVIWAIVGGQTNGATVKHANTRTRVGLNSGAGKSETSFALFTAALSRKLTRQNIRIYRV